MSIITLSWIVIGSLMYLEGLAVALLALSALATKPWHKVFSLVWPVSMPVYLYKLYHQYKFLFQNPLFTSLSGFSTNPFLMDATSTPHLGSPTGFDFTALLQAAQPTSEEDSNKETE